MAKNTLDPMTHQKLAQLARRRRRLLVARGAFAAVLTLLLAMAAVAAADRLVVLSTPVRIGLSVLAYLTVAVVIYLVSVRYLLRFPSRAELARLIESAEPTLREDLVSAVELSRDDAALYDSPAFRAVLQRNVARRLANIDTDRVLPWRLVAWWAAVSTGATVITLVLIMVPGLRYGDLLARAMMPAADLDRVSDVTITLVSPALDASGRVPMNDDLPIEVQVAGGSFGDVVMDVEHRPGERDKLTMWKGETPGRYNIDLAVGDAPLRFRVRAGDGQTRYYQLNPMARPAIKTFRQIVHAPEYTGWEPQRLSGEDGAIDALVGSVVDLTLSASQPIRSGRLVLELPEGEQHVPLYVDPADATTLTTSLPIEASSPYRVELVARETGFDNPQSQRYEINARPDQLPVVQLTKPEGTLGRSADALVQMVGRAGDDVGLREVARELRVNGGAWGPELVAVGNGGRINAPLDLLPLALRVGDAVELRLAATDLAGNTAYSSSARLMVTPDGLELAAEPAVQELRGLLNALERSTASLAEARRRYETSRSSLGGDAMTARQSATQALIAEQSLRDELRRAADAADRALSSSRPGAEADLLVGIGRAIALADAELSQSPYVRGDDEGIGRAMRGLASAERALADAGRDLRPHVSAREAALIVQRLRVLITDLDHMSAQADYDEQIDAELGRARLERRLSLTREQAGRVATMLGTLGQRPESDRYRDRMRDAAIALNDAINAQDQALRSDPATELMLMSARALRERLVQLEQMVWPAWSDFADHARDTLRRQPRPMRLDAEGLDAVITGVREDRADTAIAPMTQRLHRRAELEEARPAADNGFVVLVSRSEMALELIGLEALAGEEPEVVLGRLESLRQALVTIETVQGLADLRTMVGQLAVREREGLGAASRPPLEHRLDWAAAQPRFDAVARTLQQDARLREAMDRTRRAEQSGEAGRVGGEMEARRQIAREPENMSAELDAIVKMLDGALAEARPVLNEARNQLSAQTPSLAQRMRDLAERADALAEQSREASDEARESQEPEAIELAQELGERQQRFTGALGRLSDDLRREANQQDLMTEQGREIARDIDDAIAMLKPDAEAAQQQLDLAARQTTREHERPEAIDQAAEAQERSAQTLRQLAEHFDNLDNADQAAAEQSRQALRDAEAGLGIQEQFDAQYERMERLAELTQADDAQRLAELEAQLARDAAMQRELERIAQELADRAQERLEDAAREEAALAERLDNASDLQERNQSPVESQIDELALEAMQMNRDRVAPLEQMAERGAPEARPELGQARESLNEAAAQAQQDEPRAAERGAAQEQRERAQQLAESTREAADALRQAAQDARASVEQAREQQEAARRAADQANREAQAAQQVIESARQVERAERVREDAEDVARRAEELAREAQVLNNAVQQRGEQAEQTRQAGAQQQQGLAEQAGQAAAELGRAARHEQRLGDEAQAAQLEQAARQTDQIAEQALPEAGERIGQPGPMQQAEQATRDAEQTLRDQAAQLDAQGQPQQGQPGQQPQPQQGGQPGSPQQAQHPQPGEGAPQQAQRSQDQPQRPAGLPGPLPPEVAQQLARELDRLDEQLNGRAQSPSNEDPLASAQQSDPQSAQSQPGQLQDSQAQGQGDPQQADGQAQGQPQPGQGQPQPGQGQGQPQQAQGQQQGQPQPGQAQGQPTPGGRPIDAAAQAQAQAIRDTRNGAMPGQPNTQPGAAMAQGQQPGQQPGMGLAGSDPLNESTFDPSQLAGRPADDNRDWGDLPPRMAEDLSRGERDRAPAEYLDQVDAYFRAIARRAREQRDEE